MQRLLLQSQKNNNLARAFESFDKLRTNGVRKWPAEIKSFPGQQQSSPVRGEQKLHSVRGELVEPYETLKQSGVLSAAFTTAEPEEVADARRSLRYVQGKLK